VGGAAWAFWSVMWSTSVQTLVPVEVLNRVTAYEVAGSVSGVALGQALVGPASAAVAPRDLLVFATFVVAAVVAALLLIRPVRDLRAADAVAPIPSGTMHRGSRVRA